ncbi:MAG: hypothetical protein HY720_00215 [Planctomycetes bacterium]|nr:hypothetical protein [Planctomycetota bacterium]
MRASILLLSAGCLLAPATARADVEWSEPEPGKLAVRFDFSGLDAGDAGAVARAYVDDVILGFLAQAKTRLAPPRARALAAHALQVLAGALEERVRKEAADAALARSLLEPRTLVRDEKALGEDRVRVELASRIRVQGPEDTSEREEERVYRVELVRGARGWLVESLALPCSACRGSGRCPHRGLPEGESPDRCASCRGSGACSPCQGDGFRVADPVGFPIVEGDIPTPPAIDRASPEALVATYRAAAPRLAGSVEASLLAGLREDYEQALGLLLAPAPLARELEAGREQGKKVLAAAAVVPPALSVPVKRELPGGAVEILAALAGEAADARAPPYRFVAVPGDSGWRLSASGSLCESCAGAGSCELCEGTGTTFRGDKCSRCEGSGKCAACEGEGYVVELFF